MPPYLLISVCYFAFTETENTDTGVYLGFSMAQKYRVFVPLLSAERLKDIEREATSDRDLVKSPFLAIFEDYVTNHQDKICCLKREGREVLNQTYLHVCDKT